MIDKEKAQEAKKKGNAAFSAQNFAEAVEHFTEAISHDPADYVLYSNRSGAHASLHKYEEALQDAEKCIDLKKDWPKGYSRKGAACLGLKEFTRSIEAYQQGLALDPNNEALAAGLRQAQEEKTNTRRLVVNPAKLMSAMERMPKMQEYMNDPKFMELLSKTFSDPGALSKAAQQDPRILELLSACASCPDDEESEEPPPPPPKPKVEEPEVPKTPEQAEGDEWKTKGNSLYKERKFDEAIEAYDKAIAANPSDISYLTNKAAVYLEMKEFDKCLAECQKAIDIRYEVRADFAKVAKTYCRMAVCYTKMKDYKQAIAAYEKALTEDNNRQTRLALKEAERMLDKFNAESYVDHEKAEEHREKGNDYFKAHDYPNAKKEYDEAIRRNPTDAKLYSNRAAALTKLVAYPQALEDCDKCLELDPSFVKAHSRKGGIHFLMKDYNRAMSSYDAGLKLDPSNEECRNGKMQVIQAISSSQDSSVADEEQIKHSIADPEIQKILGDPQFRFLLNNLQENPAAATDALKDPKFSEGLQKLMAAGIVRIGSK